MKLNRRHLRRLILETIHESDSTEIEDKKSSIGKARKEVIVAMTSLISSAGILNPGVGGTWAAVLASYMASNTTRKFVNGMVDEAGGNVKEAIEKGKEKIKKYVAQQKEDFSDLLN